MWPARPGRGVAEVNPSSLAAYLAATSDATLFDHKRVVYGGDLGEVAPVAAYGTSVAVIANPRGDLEGARKEGQLVARRTKVDNDNRWFGARATREYLAAVEQGFHARVMFELLKGFKR